MKKIKTFLGSPYFMVLLFAIKMFIYYNLIKVNRMELFIIVISLAVWGTIFVLFGRSGLKRKRAIFISVYFLLSLLMFADTMYYNYYNQTVSIRQLWQVKSVTAVPKSFLATVIPSSFLLFVDIPFAYHYFKKYCDNFAKTKWKLDRRATYVLIAFAVFIVTLIINPFKSAAIARVNSVEFFTNHVNDIYETISSNLSTGNMEEKEILEVIDEKKQEITNPRYFGIGQGKNLIVIQLEAIQEFLIGATYEGQEITPNLNKLLEKDTLFFDQYFANNGKGNTSDAEFSSLNSLYPTIDGESYRLYETNTFNGLPWLLREQGYRAFAVHGYEGEFWNREVAYPNQGFEDYISMEDMVQDEIIGMGISDKSMFKQLIPILQQQQEPYFSFVITLTNHHPFILEEQYQSLQLAPEDLDNKFGAYLQTSRYTDEAIGQFIDDLKEAGLYENTVIALYGDHHGLNCGMEDIQLRTSEFLGRNYDYDEMMNVPLIIHLPGSGITETISTTGGHIDFMPTIANIMGLTPSHDFILGQDIVNVEEGFVAFTNYLFEGSFVMNDVIFQISREEIFEGSRAWEIETGNTLDIEEFRDEYEKALTLKKVSKEILEQNLISNNITRTDATKVEEQ